jgi:hypothetical protein
MATASEAKTKAHRTRNHDTIRQWAEARGGHPAMVEGTEILRIDFNEPDQKLKQVSWEDFFRVFDDRDVAFLYQDQTHDGGKSRFFKFVRSGEEDEEE